MGRHLKEVAEKIIESVESYNISIETVAPLVEKIQRINEQFKSRTGICHAL